MEQTPGESGASVAVASPAAGAPRAAPSAFPWWIVVVAFALPSILALMTYAPYVRDYFAIDDWVWLRAVHGRSLVEVARRGFIFNGFTEFDAPTPYFRPAADIAFKLELMTFGLRPAPYHAVNLALHGVVCGLGALLFGRLLRSPLAGIVIASLFAVSPAYEIAVTWISQLSELLGAAFALAALVAFERYASTGGSRGRRWLIASIAAFAVAILAKESQSLTVLLLPAVAWVTPDRRRSTLEVATVAAAIAIVAFGYSGFLALHEYLHPVAGGSYSLGPHVPRHMLEYIQHIVFPFASQSGWADGVREVLAIAYVAAGVFCIASLRRVPALLFVWSLLWLVPFSLFEPANQSRYAYLATLPSIGFAVALAMEVRAAVRVDARAWNAAAAVLVLAAIGISARSARGEQKDLSSQSARYETAIDAVRTQCRGLPAGSTIVLTDAGLLDPYDVIVRSALNVFFDEVRVATATKGGTVGGSVCSVQIPRGQ